MKNSALYEVMSEAASMQGGVLALIQRAYVAGFDEGVQHACNTFERITGIKTPAPAHNVDPADTMVPLEGVIDTAHIGDYMMDPSHD